MFYNTFCYISFAYLRENHYLCCTILNHYIMKQLLPLLALVAIFASCNPNSPKLTKQVTFHISSFSQTTSPLNAPAKAPIYDEAENGTPLTDIYVFDGSDLLCHQTSDQDDFGTITLSLTHELHNLSFIATRSTNITTANGVMTMENVRPTFGKLLTLNVTSSTHNQDLTLDRITGKLIITILDAFPADAKEIEFVINPRYSQLDVTTLLATNGQSVAQKVDCSSKAGKKDQAFSFNLLAPSITDEYTADVTINVYDSSNALIHAVLVEGVRLAANTKTLLSGKVFRGTDATLNVNHTWNTDIVGSF